MAAAEEVEVLPDLHVVVDAEAVRHVAEDASNLLGVPSDRGPGDLGVAARRRQRAWPGSAASSSCRRRSARRGRRSRRRSRRGRDRRGRASRRSASRARGPSRSRSRISPSSWTASWRPIDVLALVGQAEQDRAGRRVDEPSGDPDVDCRPRDDVVRRAPGPRPSDRRARCPAGRPAGPAAGPARSGRGRPQPGPDSLRRAQAACRRAPRSPGHRARPASAVADGVGRHGPTLIPRARRVAVRRPATGIGR